MVDQGVAGPVVTRYGVKAHRQADRREMPLHARRVLGRAEAEALASSVGGHAIGADLTDPEGAQGLVAEALQLAVQRGGIAAWVNSAAAFEQRAFLETDDALWARTLQLGLLSPVACIRQVAPQMLDGGVIINILDVAATQAWRGYSHHCVTKAALQMLIGEHLEVKRELIIEIALDAVSIG